MKAYCRWLSPNISYDEFCGMVNPLQWHYHLDKNNDNLLLNRAYLRTAGSTGWIVWMDKQGNIKTNFHNVAVDGHEYYFFQKITITDEYCDLLAFPTSSGHEGYDVIRITIDGEITKHGEMVTAAGAPEFITGVSAQQIGDKVIVSGRPTPRYNLVVYGFEAEDLGLGTVNTKDQQWAPHATKLTAYPNPATDYISVPLPEGVMIDQYQVVSYDARIQLTNSDRHKENVLVKVHQLASGLYLLRCRDVNGKMYTAEFIKQ